MGPGACAKLTVRSAHICSGSPSGFTSAQGMSLDVFMAENSLARARAEARKRAVKRLFNRLLKRSRQPQ
jgi:hypothetical protein